MAISGLKTWATSDSVNAANLNADKTVLEAKFNGNIDTDDLSAGAVTNAKLENKHYEIVLNMQVDGVVWTACNAGEKVAAMVGLPADVDTTQYDIVQADWCIVCNTNAIASAPAFSLHWGYFTSDSVFTLSDTMDTAQSTGTVSANQGSAGTCALVDSSLVMDLTYANFLCLIVDTVGDFDAADQILTVSIKLKRTNGLRS